MVAKQGTVETPSFSISGQFTEDGGVHVRAVESSGTHYWSSFEDHDFMLLDASGAELAWTPVTRESIRSSPHRDNHWKPGQSVGCQTIRTSNFRATLPRVDGGVTLAIEYRGKRLWTRHAPAGIPDITNVACGVVDGVGRLHWNDNIDADSPEYRVRVSFDDANGMFGRIRRRGCGTEDDNNRQQAPRNVFEFSLDELPAGVVALTVAIDSGFYTTESESVTVSVPEHPLTVEMGEPTLLPSPDLTPRFSVSATATAFGGDWGRIRENTAFEWTVDDVPIGNGHFLQFDVPTVGRHTLTVLVQWNGKRVSKSVEFEVTEKTLADAEEYRLAMTEVFGNRLGRS